MINAIDWAIWLFLHVGATALVIVLAYCVMGFILDLCGYDLSIRRR